jgi:Uma2 family endonuclease
MADQRLWIPEQRIYTYPDVMVVQGPLIYQEGRRDTLVNPILIVEVLSKSTQDYDRGNKFAAYRTLPTFQEYVLVDQYNCQVEHYAKTGDKQWVFREYDQMENSVQLVSIPFAIALAEIYDKVEFEPTQEGEQ